MSWLISIAIVATGVLSLQLVDRLRRWRRREQGLRVADVEAVRMVSEPLAVRVFVDRSVPAGPRPRGYRQGRCRVLISDTRLVLSTDWGRLIEMRADRPGEMRWAGPRRIVFEGQHPTERTNVRAEVLMDDEEVWLAAASEVSGVTARSPKT